MAATARRIVPARLEGQSALARLELKSACARFEVKSVSDDGTFEGYASLFNREDLGHDVIQPGAFRDSLLKRGASKIKMLFQHNPSELIGVWDEVREDERGLYVKGRLMLAVAKAREVLALMRAGALDGLSIGFKAEKARREARSGVRRIEKIDLWEISVVTFPMLPEARVAAVKSSAAERREAHESDALKITEREFERWLTRERKLSRSEARAVMRGGFAGLKAARERAQTLRDDDHGLLGAALRRAARVMRTEATALAFDQQNAATLKSSWLKVKSEIEYVRMLAAARAFAAALHREQKYSPDQPRVPAGNSDGGQWTSGGGGLGGGFDKVGVGGSATKPPDGNVQVANSAQKPGGKDPAGNRVPDGPSGGGAGTGSMGRGTASTPLQELLKPGGQDVGSTVGRARPGIRTLPKDEFDTLKTNILDGSTEIQPRPGYNGQWFKRQDGSIVGLRHSPKSGDTIDVIQSLDESILSNGYKVHVK